MATLGELGEPSWNTDLVCCIYFHIWEKHKSISSYPNYGLSSRLGSLSLCIAMSLRESKLWILIHGEVNKKPLYYLCKKLMEIIFYFILFVFAFMALRKKWIHLFSAQLKENSDPWRSQWETSLLSFTRRKSNSILCNGINFYNNAVEKDMNPFSLSNHT